MRSRIGMVLAATALAFASLPAVTQGAVGQKAVMTAGGRRFEMRRTDPWGFGGMGVRYGRRAGYGWTTRHAQRVARKKRNQARNRAACRG